MKDGRTVDKCFIDAQNCFDRSVSWFPICAVTMHILNDAITSATKDTNYVLYKLENIHHTIPGAMHVIDVKYCFLSEV
jgi:hypothetical protein